MKRASFLEHVGWTGGGIAFAMTATGTFAAAAPGSDFTFVQISDSHIGFSLPANPDVLATHLSKVEQFNTAKSVLGRLKAPLFVIPGEHDAIGTEGAARFAAAFPNAAAPDGWWSFDRNGVHFVALVNVFNFETMGVLGSKQLDWLAKDLAPLKSDTPIVVFGHVPLYALYPAWGWTTEDGAKAIAMLKRFSAVTVLNGHIHQIITQRDGNISFATAAATAYPQPAPGTAAAPGPLTVPAPELLSHLGYRSVSFTGIHAAVSDRSLQIG
jgi:3',5'-cyclic AMP phosphodiesterase CpdA